MVFQGYAFIQKIILRLEGRLGLLQRVDVINFYLRQDVQFAGYSGSRSRDESLLIINHVRDLEFLAAKEQAVIAKHIFPGSHVKELPKKFIIKIDKQEIKANTDILFIKDIPKATYKLASFMQDPCDAITTDRRVNFPSDTLFAIADPISTEKFIASDITMGKHISRQSLDNMDTCLQRVYGINAEVIALQWVIYYLAKSSSDLSTYTLYRHDIIGSAEAIVNGVEDWYVLPLKDKKKPIKTIGVEVGILLRTENQLFANQTFIWRDKLYNFTDGYLRKPVIVTIMMRNAYS